MSTTGSTSRASGNENSARSREFVTSMIGDQLCGIPVLDVQDVLGPQPTTPIPLAPPEVAGSLNLRGRVVTAVELRTRMGLPPRDDDSEGMSIVVEHNGELYSLIVDSVGEVLKTSPETFERNPSTLNSLWRSFSEGVYRLEQGLLVVLDPDLLLNFGGIGNEDAA